MDLKACADKVQVPAIAPSDFLVFDPLNRVCVLDIDFLIRNGLEGSNLERILRTSFNVSLINTKSK